MLVPSPPLDPSGDEGRRLLRDELLKGEYHQQHLWQRLLAWLGRRFDGSVRAASGSSWITVLVTMLLVALLVTGLALVLSRISRDRRTRARPAALLSDDRPSAADLRRRAEASLAEGRHGQAVVDGFRALATRQIERGRLDDQPGATAHEVAARLAASYPEEGSRVGQSADLFDATMYGDRPATREDAAGVLGLDDTLAGAR
jgi:Tfp pilus assembly protein PilV